MAMSYGYIYVASCSMGANRQQTLNAFLEAEAYDGPSLIFTTHKSVHHVRYMLLQVPEPGEFHVRI